MTHLPGKVGTSSPSVQIPTPGRGGQTRMKILKILCAIGFLTMLVSNIWSISGWIEARGVYDDICYLRQAHLFERFGLRGIDTNIVLDDNQYFVGRLRAIGFPEWKDVKRFPCHTMIPDAEKYVLQYPPAFR